LGLSPFFRAPFYCQFLRLLSWHFTQAWFAVNLAAALAFANLLPAALGRRDVSYPFVVALFVSFTLNVGGGQDASIMLLVIAVALWLVRTGRYGWAGAALALTLQKPSLYAPLMLVPLAGKHWRMFRGYAGGAVALAAVSLWTVGVQGAYQYLDSVKRYALVPYKMPTARGVVESFSMAPAWAAPLAFAGLVMIVIVARRADLPSAICFALPAALFANPQSYGHDFAILILPVAHFYFLSDRVMSLASAVLFFPLIHFLMVLPPPWSALYELSVGAYGSILAWRLARSRRPATDPRRNQELRESRSGSLS